MAALKTLHQRWIVVRLALYGSPKDVAEAFGKQFPGFTITRQQAWEYDCSKAVNREKRSEDLVTLFDETRAEFKAQTEDVLIATEAGRLAEYQRLFDEAKGEGLRKTQIGILEQVAKEKGGLYTNKRDVTSNGQTVKAYVGFDPDEV